MVGTQQKQFGFTLVEIVVCLAVAGLLVVTLNSVTSGYLLVSQKGRFLSLVNAFAEAKVETLRNLGYNDTPLGTTNITSQLPSTLPPSRLATMTVTAPSLGIKQVTMTISYKESGQTRTYSYTTYLGELGVGQY